LPPISVGDGILDLVVIGCGPAGLALAAESGKLGLKVGLIGPDLPFTNNYGVWEDEFKGILPSCCIFLITLSLYQYTIRLDPYLGYNIIKHVTESLQAYLWDFDSFSLVISVCPSFYEP